jgi:hypothetical protein
LERLAQSFGFDRSRVKGLRAHLGDKGFAQRLQTRLRKGRAVNGQQQMRPALKIKANGNGLACGPFGQRAAKMLGKKVRKSRRNCKQQQDGLGHFHFSSRTGLSNRPVRMALR